MKILSISWKNFTSYGSRVQTIEMQDGHGFFLVSGENGWGKSTISDVIKFGLYGTLGSGKKLKDIPNRINGGAWVKITLETRGKNVIVERGIDPSFINLTVDGVEYNRANKRGPNEYLVEELLEIPFHIFNNIISLSVNDFKSFLSMDADSKRKIIDKLFGFQIINVMREIIKERLGLFKKAFDDAGAKMEAARKSMQTSSQELDNLLAKLKNKNVELMESTRTDLNKYRNILEIHNKRQSDFTIREREYRTSVQAAVSLVSERKAIVDSLKHRLKFWDNDVCPTCYSQVHTSEGSIKQKEKMEKELNETIGLLRSAEENLQKVRGKEDELETERATIIDKGGKIRSNIDQLTRTLKELTSIPEDDQADSIKSIISKMEEQQAEASQEKAQTEERITWMRLLDDTLSDKGIKQMAIKAAVTPLNNEIIKLLQEMHMDHGMYFDEEFDAHITHLGEEIAIPTLSTGERKRVDFVALCALIRVMKTRFPGVNLLFLDEVLDGLDAVGVNSVLKVLSRTCRELSLNVFIISFNPLPREVFDFVVNIDKRYGFSSLSVEVA